MAEELPPNLEAGQESPEEGRLILVDSPELALGISDNGHLNVSPVAPSPDELARLMGSQWHGFVELEFPSGPDVHDAVFTVISTALGERSHFSMRLEQTLCVTMAVENDSPACRAQLGEIAAYLGEVLPNSVVKRTDIESSEPASPGPPQRPVLSIVENAGDAGQD